MRDSVVRRTLLVLVASVLGLVVVGSPAQADEPSATPDPTPSATLSATPSATPTGSVGPSVDVDDAVLRWGVSNEANNAAFAPRTYNFFSAGKVADPGTGGHTITASRWRARAGNVVIEKWTGSRWRTATWAGLSTDAHGSTLTPTDDRFSDHQVVLGHGAGTVDAEAGTASIRWRGSFTILFYSGMSFFYVTDPALEVANGRGTLTGTLSGFASSQTDTSVWEPVAPKRVTLADLPRVDLGDDGFTADAAYDHVTVTGVPQVLDGSRPGSFPQSWVAFADRLGTAAFWYSSGGATDAYKAALPVTVGYAGGDADAPAPTHTASASPTQSPDADPDASDVPTSTAPTQPTRPTRPVGTDAIDAVDVGAPDPPTDVVAAAVPAGGPVVRLVAAPASPRAGPATDPDRGWWLAGLGLLCIAAITSAGAFASSRR